MALTNEREHHIKVLEQFLHDYQEWGEVLELEETIKYAISSLKTDPNEVEAHDMAIKALEQEQTTRNCFGCKYSKDNHNAGTEECHLCMWENQYTPTTKNDLPHCQYTDEEIAKSFIEDVEAVKELLPTTKNNLGVDWENYKDADGNCLDDLILEVLQNNFDCGNTYGYKVADEIIELLPSVTPQEPKIVTIAENKYDKEKLKELVNKAVLTVAPQEPQIFKWCDTCREYDQEKHCCHRYSKVIRDTVEEMKQEQEPKTGHWVKIKPYPLQMHDYECSECGYETDDNTENYCSDC